MKIEAYMLMWDAAVVAGTIALCLNVGWWGLFLLIALQDIRECDC